MTNRLFIMALIVVFSHSTLALVSQKRFPGESFQQALQRNKNNLPQATLKSSALPAFKDTPVNNSVFIHQIDISKISKVASYQEVMTMFYLIRDSRFLETVNNKSFKRRISWLYPEDGCFARAALSGMKLKVAVDRRPSKVFAFGDLVVSTPFADNGEVNWWYHVAGAVQYEGNVYILDPALDAKAPLLLDDWIMAMGNKTLIKAAICNSFTYDPFDKCADATESSDRKALADELRYLDKEWKQINKLGFDPYLILGSNPPWL